MITVTIFDYFYIKTNFIHFNYKIWINYTAEDTIFLKYELMERTSKIKSVHIPIPIKTFTQLE